MEKQKKSRFGLGLLIGSIVGAITALFVAPKTGRQMRETAKKWLAQELEKIKKEVGKIDKRKYQKAVEKVLAKVKKEAKKDVNELDQIKRALMRGWEKVKKDANQAQNQKKKP